MGEVIQLVADLGAPGSKTAAQFWIRNDCAHLKATNTEDELRDAAVDLMLADTITEGQMNRGLQVIRERLRSIHGRS